MAAMAGAGASSNKWPIGKRSGSEGRGGSDGKATGSAARDASSLAAASASLEVGCVGASPSAAGGSASAAPSAGSTGPEPASCESSSWPRIAAALSAAAAASVTSSPAGLRTALRDCCRAWRRGKNAEFAVAARTEATCVGLSLAGSDEMPRGSCELPGLAAPAALRFGLSNCDPDKYGDRKTGRFDFCDADEATAVAAAFRAASSSLSSNKSSKLSRAGRGAGSNIRGSGSPNAC